jgi:predicted dehydrogenase
MDKVRLGFIGIGNRGEQLLDAFMKQDDAEPAAFCDVYKPYAERRRDKIDKEILSLGRIPPMKHLTDGTVDAYSDYRDLLDRKDIDAVVIATPDHWHALQTVHAFEAGKDVFVEKPLTITIDEGRKMVEAEERTGRTGAVCLNRRGSSIYQELSRRIPEGLIGKVVSASAARNSNMFPDGIGRREPADPPEGFDWDMWLGPRAYRPYQYNLAPYYFRWWSDYSSQMGNWSVHYMDVIRWLMGETAPAAVTAVGGKFAVDDDRDIPDTMTVLFEFESGAVVQFQINEASAGHKIPHGEIEMQGTKAVLQASQDGYNVIPSSSGQFQKWDRLAEPEERVIEGDAAYGDLGIKEDSTANLARNFIDCVKDKSTKPFCSLEDGHRSTTFAHLANISLKMKQRLEWDARTERFTNCDAANEHLAYDYREPWKL